jgi:hypothetical protein
MVKEIIGKNKLKGMSKRSLKNFNLEEARGWVIGRSIQIEYRLNAKIVEFFKPVEKRAFEKIMLNSSILDMGSKLKILKNIGAIDTKTMDKIRKLNAIRNGFAHAEINEHIIIEIVGETDDGAKLLGAHGEPKIEVMKSDGVIEMKDAYEYLLEFWTLNTAIREII